MHCSLRHKTVIPGLDVISIRSDCSFPRHTHDEFGLGYIVDGGHQSWSGRGLVEAAAGDVITVNPGEVHDGLGHKGRPRHWKMLFLCPEFVADNVDQPSTRIEFHHPVLRAPATYQPVVSAITALTNDGADRDHALEVVALALGSLLAEPDMSAVRSVRSPPVEAVLELIRDCWSLPLSLDDFAATASMSKFQILRTFSREIGSTPHAFLTQHRVKQARRLILDGVPIAEAAVASGFSDQSHMTRTFVRQFGLTPGRYLNARSV